MSKSAVKNLTQVLALELGRAGIRVNSVAPGYILTEMHRLEARLQAQARGISEDERLRQLQEEVPLGRHGTPEDVSDVVGWLVSDDSRYVHGQTIAVNGGLTFS
jgi:NAD(P)-dependent dehydrogenase (short-subunit alcohol dehydrogenase family)